MRKILLAIFLLLIVWVVFARCFVMQNRWSDRKAHRIFDAKKVELLIADTLAGDRHIHYAVTGPGTLPNYAIYM